MSFSCDDVEKGIWRRGSKQSEREGVWKMERRWKSPMGDSREKHTDKGSETWHCGVRWNWESSLTFGIQCEWRQSPVSVKPMERPQRLELYIWSHRTCFYLHWGVTRKEFHSGNFMSACNIQKSPGGDVIIRLAGFQPVIDGRWQRLEYSCGTGDWEVRKQWRHWWGRRI